LHIGDENKTEAQAMAMQVERSLHKAEEHLLRAEAEMAQAAKIFAAVQRADDPRLAQLADVVSTHGRLVGQLATIAGSALDARPPRLKEIV
jgi:hypothetical protein